MRGRGLRLEGCRRGHGGGEGGDAVFQGDGGVAVRGGTVTRDARPGGYKRSDRALNLKTFLANGKGFQIRIDYGTICAKNDWDISYGVDTTQGLPRLDCGIP